MKLLKLDEQLPYNNSYEEIWIL